MPAHKEHIIADCHCDTLWYFNKDSYRFANLNPGRQVDLPRLLEGRVRILFFAVCVAAEIAKPAHLPEALRYIALYLSCLAENRNILHGIETAADLNLSGKDQSVACLLALEGAEPLAGNPELVDPFYRLGVRSVSLTWNNSNRFASSCTDNSSHGGLRRAGRQLIGALVKKRIILDLAHLSARGFFEALDLYDFPPLVSHANARALIDHPRNLTDAQLKALAAKDGVVGLSFYPLFVSGEKSARLEQLADHFVHVAEVAGIEHVAIGSDFDGIAETVDQLSDASRYALLAEALYRRGFQENEVEAITAGNVRRLLNATIAREK